MLRLTCSQCRSGLVIRWQGDARGTHECTRCGRLVPELDGFVFHTERELDDGRDRAGWRAQLAARVHTSEAALAALAARPRAGGDTYAAFQPFNESGRTLFAFLPRLRELLRPGARILDTWNRTGWTGALL